MSISILEETGLQSFGLGQTPTSAALTDARSAIIAADADRAYVVVTLESVTAGDVFVAVGATAVALAGQKLELDIPQKFFGGEVLNGICGTAVATAVVLVQAFLRGLPRQGDAA